MSLRRTKSAIISRAGSFDIELRISKACAIILGSKTDFLSHNICKVPREVLKPEVEDRGFKLVTFVTFNFSRGTVNALENVKALENLVLLVKRNTLILYSYFHRMFMFLLLMSVTFYRCIEKRHSKSCLPHFSTFVKILLNSCKKVTAGIRL